VSSAGSPPPLDVDRSLRLEEDSRLAEEAQKVNRRVEVAHLMFVNQEMQKIVSQFANLLHEEEERVSMQAEILQRRSSQVSVACRCI